MYSSRQGSLKDTFCNHLKHGFFHQNKGTPPLTRQCSGVYCQDPCLWQRDSKRTTIILKGSESFENDTPKFPARCNQCWRARQSGLGGGRFVKIGFFELSEAGRKMRPTFPQVCAPIPGGRTQPSSATSQGPCSGRFFADLGGGCGVVFGGSQLLHCLLRLSEMVGDQAMEESAIRILLGRTACRRSDLGNRLHALKTRPRLMCPQPGLP